MTSPSVDAASSLARREKALESLAKWLYIKLEHVEPTDGPDWEELTEYERENFRIVVQSLVDLRRGEILCLLGK